MRPSSRQAAFRRLALGRPGDRALLLHRLSDAIGERAEELAMLEARNAGKPITDARGEIGMVVESSATTRARRNGCSARRSRSPAGST